MDLFAGSGSLGLEALSRGANAVTFVDRSSRVCQVLRKTQADLGIPKRQCEVIQQEALAWLARPPRRAYDLVFADPPYLQSKRDNWWPSLLGRLRPHLAPNARVCLESPSPVAAGSEWACLRSGRAGAANWCILTAAC
jgi:16S rRNA (guanine966-N2)-methyltransferase